MCRTISVLVILVVLFPTPTFAKSRWSFLFPKSPTPIKPNKIPNLNVPPSKLNPNFKFPKDIASNPSAKPLTKSSEPAPTSPGKARKDTEDVGARALGQLIKSQTEDKKDERRIAELQQPTNLRAPLGSPVPMPVPSTTAPSKDSASSSGTFAISSLIVLSSIVLIVVWVQKMFRH